MNITSTSAIIIAGGKGTRVAGAAKDLPKCLIPIGDKPLLQHQIEFLKANGLLNIKILIGHLGDKIVGYFGDGTSFGVNISYFKEKYPLGTAGCVKEFETDIGDEDFLVLYGDILAEMKLADLFLFHESNAAAATLVVHPNDHPHDSDIVVLDERSAISAIIQKDNKSGFYPNCVNAAIYVLSKRVFKYIDKDRFSDFMKDVFPKMLMHGERLCGYRTAEYIKDMGTVERLAEVRADFADGRLGRFQKGQQRPAIFMDRDGTIVKKIDLLRREEELTIYPFSAQAIRRINNSNYLAILITNQPVIARNLCTPNELKMIHNKLETLLGQEKAYLNDICYCPHHPDGGYPGENSALKIDCECRKPKTGMIQYAAERYNIDLKASWMIGDTTADIQTGINAGQKTILVRTGDAGKDQKWRIDPDYTFDDVEQAIDFILMSRDLYSSYIRAILDKIHVQKDATPIVISIGGLARSGKSTFAAYLKNSILEANLSCQVLSLDSWLLNLNERNGKQNVRERYRYRDI
ncbi:MAG TPA: HAD-IIIA family hydrolase, partial [Nitrospirota bacterium]|nr:HAD-IIIA family hydrolase [Nitrospirota bacterium]